MIPEQTEYKKWKSFSLNKETQNKRLLDTTPIIINANIKPKINAKFNSWLKVGKVRNGNET